MPPDDPPRPPPTWQSLALRLAPLGHPFASPRPGLEFGGFHHAEALAEHLAEADTAHAAELQAAILQYARTGTLPPLEPMPHALLHLRARHALLLLNDLGTQVGPKVVTAPTGHSEELMLQWLLLGVWKSRGHWWLPMAAQELLERWSQR